MNHGSLFSGIGGFDLAAEWMGWNNIFHCEWNEFGQKVLKHHFPNSISYADITKTDFTIHRGNIDILTGGFPCQPYSLAGKRKGKEDERHLWPEMLRAIREIRPTWVVGENVLGLVNWNGGLVFDEVQSDLEDEGYEVQPYVLPACAVNAPHRRDRVWFVAYSECNGRRKGAECEHNNNTERKICKDITDNGNKIRSEFRNGCNDRTTPNTNSNGQHRSDGEHEKQSGEGRIDALGNIEQMGEYDTTNTENIGHESSRNTWERRSGFENGDSNGFFTNTDSRRQPGKEYRQEESGRTSKKGIPGNWENFPTQSPICTGNDGISSRLDGITFPKWRNESIKAGGNAIVPNVAYQIFKTIEQYSNL